MTVTAYVALSLLALFLLTMPVFAIISRHRPVDEDVARRPTTPILGVWVRDWLMWLISPLERVLVAWRVSPDVFNYVGMVLGLAAGVFYAKGDISVGGWLILIGGLADIIDGRIARARGIGSDYGEFLDSMMDRFAEVFAFAGLAVFFEPFPWAIVATVVALGGSLMVSYARAKGEAVKVDCRGGIMQRAERLVLLAGASLIDRPVTSYFGWHYGWLLLGVIGLIGLGSMGTAVYRTVYISRALKRMERENQAA